MVPTLTLIIWGVYFLSLFIVIFWLLVLFEKGFQSEYKRLKKFFKVSVVIPAYNEEDTIEKTVNSVLNLDYPKNKLEIIVVNDGSTDATAKIVRDLIKKYKSFDLKLINQVNKGKGSALNNALKIAKGDIFVCLDADSIVKKDALKRMVPYFEDKNVAVVLPLMKVYKPKTLLQKIQGVEYLINFFYKKIMACLDCIHVTPGPFSVYRASVLKKVGGFDVNNLTEDLEMALRLQKYNYKIIQLLAAEVYTIAPKNFKSLYKQRNRWYKGTLFNLIKHRVLIANRKYGDFGLFHMPIVLITGFLTVLMVSLMTYNYVLIPLSRKIYDLGFINYNLFFNLNESIHTYNILRLSYTNLFFVIIAFIIIIWIIIYSHKFTRESLKRYGYLTIILYLFTYSILMAIMWVGVIFDLIFKRKQKW